MVKSKTFIGTITQPSIEEDLNLFLKQITQEQLADVKFSTNLANIKKSDGTTGIIVITSALVMYEE